MSTRQGQAAELAKFYEESVPPEIRGPIDERRRRREIDTQYVRFYEKATMNADAEKHLSEKKEAIGQITGEIANLIDTTVREQDRPRVHDFVKLPGTIVG